METRQIKSFLHLSKRLYGAEATEKLGMQGAVSVISKASKDMKAEELTDQKKKFWMRDPKTGNWIPESHFNENDVAEPREKYLSKKDSKTT